MPKRGDRTLRRSGEGLIGRILRLLANDAKRPHDQRGPCASRAGVVRGPGKDASAPAPRPRPRLTGGPICCEQYVAPTRAQRVALSE